VQHVRSRKSRADENSHEIYVEIESRGNDVVEHLRKRMRGDVKMHVISAGNITLQHAVYFQFTEVQFLCILYMPV